MIEFDIEEAFDDQSYCTTFNVSEEEAEKATGKYSLKVTTITRVEPATINQELFDKVFGKEAVKTEEEFIEKLKETIGENYKRETEHLLDHEIQHHYVNTPKSICLIDF